MKPLNKDFIDLLERIVHDWRHYLKARDNDGQIERNIRDMEKLIDELKEENK